MNFDQTGAYETEYAGLSAKQLVKEHKSVLRKIDVFDRMEARVFNAIDFAESAGLDEEAIKLQSLARQHRDHADQLVTRATVLASLIG